MSTSRSTVPPRREELVMMYEAANFHAVEAQQEAEEFVEEGRVCMAMRPQDFRAAHANFEQAIAAFLDSRKHREAELKYRVRERRYFAHLDDWWTATDLKLATGYCARRLHRLKYLQEIAYVRACIAHIEWKVEMGPTWQARAEKRIIEEGLEERIKEERRRPRTFASDWGAKADRPPARYELGEAAQRLNDLKWEIRRIRDATPRLENEKRQNEAKWADLIRTLKAHNQKYNYLDEQARRHHAHLPQLSAPAPATPRQQRSSRHQEQAASTSRLQHSTTIDAWRHRDDGSRAEDNADDDEAHQWEEEYGLALGEEDDDLRSALNPDGSGAGLDSAYAGMRLGGTTPRPRDSAHGSKGGTNPRSPRRDVSESSIQARWETGMQHSQSPAPGPNAWNLDEPSQHRASGNSGWTSHWPTKKAKDEELDQLLMWSDSDHDTLVNNSARNKGKNAVVDIASDDETLY